MKDQAPNMLPPKMTGAVAPNSSNRVASDELLSSLLRINNFDSISSIKDESLDIDLSACVTITPTAIINGNSLSSSDFWRVLDESAQIPEKEEESLPASVKSEIKEEIPSSFSGTFLRPDPPALSVSPKKRFVKVNRPAVEVKKRKNSQTKLDSAAKEQSSNSSQGSSACIYIKQEISEPFLFTINQDEQEFLPEHDNEGAKLPTMLTSLPSFSEINASKICDVNKNSSIMSDVSPAHQPSETVRHVFSQAIDLSDFVGTKPIALTSSSSTGDLEQQDNTNSKCQRSGTDGRKDIWKKCPDCGKCLKLGSMWMHRKIHSDNRKYECDVCGQKFVQKINLTHHSRIHTSEKPFECPECQKRFQERSHLQRHQKYHAQTRSYRCDKCGKMYKTERCLKVHNLVHLERRPFACTVCDKSFISNSKLKQHLNIHTGARPFKCNYCPRDFTNFPNWLKHTRRRHKVDHKTGEQLENIPSYCSKKSSSSATSKATLVAKDQQQNNMNGKKSGKMTNNDLNKDEKSETNNETTNTIINNTPNQINCETSAREFDPVGQANEKSNVVTASITKRKKKTPPQNKETFFVSSPSNFVVNLNNNPKFDIGNTGGNNLSNSMSMNQKRILNGTTFQATKIEKSKNVTKYSASAFIGVDDNAVINVPVLNNSIAKKTNFSDSGISVVIAPPSFISSDTRQQKDHQNLSNNLTKNPYNPSKLYLANNIIQAHGSGQNLQIPITATPEISSNNISPKLTLKRERKQFSPKHISPAIHMTVTNEEAIDFEQTNIIDESSVKMETSDVPSKQLLNNYLDLHCLSITSAEELIMEQALEMEECGLYDTPMSAVFN